MRLAVVAMICATVVMLLAACGDGGARATRSVTGTWILDVDASARLVPAMRAGTSSVPMSSDGEVAVYEQGVIRDLLGALRQRVRFMGDGRVYMLITKPSEPEEIRFDGTFRLDGDLVVMEFPSDGERPFTSTAIFTGERLYWLGVRDGIPGGRALSMDVVFTRVREPAGDN